MSNFRYILPTRLFSLAVLILSVFSVIPVHAGKLPPKYTAIVIEAETGEVLEAENPDRLNHPASLTKMMTLYMVFDALQKGQITMDTKVPVSAHAAKQAPSKLGLRPGESVSVEVIVKGLVTKSANDAAATIAEYLGGSEESFARMMTKKAHQLGMHQSIFKNASGLPHPDQITSARDMATLARALYRDFPEDYGHFKLKTFRHKGNVHNNHNHLLGKVEGLDGIKTGWIVASGFNLAASAKRFDSQGNPVRLITVVLGGPNRHWRDNRVAELLEVNFERLGIKGAEAYKSAKRSWAAPVPTPKKDDFDVLIEEISYQDPSSSRFKRTQEDPGNWIVQVGDYPTLKDAKSKAETIKASLKEGAMSVPKVKKGRKSLYQAQITGLSRGTAKRACPKRSKQGKDCLIVPVKAEKKTSMERKVKKKGKKSPSSKKIRQKGKSV